MSLLVAIAAPEIRDAGATLVDAHRGAARIFAQLSLERVRDG